VTRLSDDYIAKANRDARRYQGQWTGTIGSMAAHVRRLIIEREEIMLMLEEKQHTTPEVSAIVEEAWAKYRQHGPTERKVYGCDGDKPHPTAAAGTTAKFGTGAVRSDAVEEFRYDLVSPIGLREVARACAEGAEKYGAWNWEKGMPVHDLLNHAIAHIYQFLEGDRSEPHLGHAAWNLLAAIHSDKLWPQLNKGTLRGPECSRPDPT
jgi:hypothetical protein